MSVVVCLLCAYVVFLVNNNYMQTWLCIKRDLIACLQCMCLHMCVCVFACEGENTGYVLAYVNVSVLLCVRVKMMYGLLYINVCMYKI